MRIPRGRNARRAGIWLPGSLMLVAALIGAVFAFSATAEAQADTYVDLSVEIRVEGLAHIFTARNTGTAIAYGVTVDIELADQVASRSDTPFKQKSGTTCSGNIPGTTCVSGVWTVGALEPGEEAEIAIRPLLASGLPCCSALNDEWTVPARAEISNTVPEEEERFKGDNTDVGWILTTQSSSVNNRAPIGQYWLEEATVDDLLPDPGDTVKFSFQVRSPGGNRASVYGAKLRLKLDDGMGTPTSTTTPPTGSTFAAATGLTRTWDWAFDLEDPTYIRNLELSTTLDNPLPGGVARSDLCLTAELTAERPDNIAVDVRPGSYTSAEICLREDPVTLLQEGETELFTIYPCVGVSTYPCSSADTVELVVNGGASARLAGIARDDAIMDPGNVVIHIRDPEGRVKTGSDRWWSSADAGFSTSIDKSRLTSADWTHFLWKIASVQLPTGANLSIRNDNNRDFVFLDTGTQTQFPAAGLTAIQQSFRAALSTYIVFEDLGTYIVDFTQETENNNGTATTTDDVVYEATGRYTFHVGPVAELEVRDGGPNPDVPSDQRAFTIVALNNGPDDAPDVQVTVTGLNDSDYVSHSATKGAFATSTGVWDIGEMREPVYQQAINRRDGETLTIITSAAASSTITASITNTQDYSVCLDSGGNDFDAADMAACTATTTRSWHTAKYYDYISDNDSATTTARAGTGANLPALKTPDTNTAAISLEWDAVDTVLNWPVTHYEVRSSDPPCQAPPPGATGTKVAGTTHVDVGVEPGDEMCYHVRAVNAQLVAGPWSAPQTGMVEEVETVTATAGAPDKPIVNAAPNTAKRREEILVSWTKPIENGSPIVSYTLEVSDTGREDSWSDSGATLGANATSWLDTGLTGGATRYYRLRATNMCDDIDPLRECHSMWSDAVSAKTDPPGQSGPPTGVSAVPDGDSAIDVSWLAPADDGGTPITRYEVQWSADGSTTTTWRSAGSTSDGDTLTLKHTGLSFGTTRYYRVAARNARGLSVWSEPPYASATTLAGVPGRPNLTASATDANTIELSWNTPADNGSAIIRFELEWSADGSTGSWTNLTNLSATDTSHDDSGLSPGTERHYRIRAVNGATPGEGSWSATRSATTPPAVPGTPTLSATANGENSIDLTWDPPSNDGGADVTSYELHWSADGAENSYSRLTSPSASARSYTHSGLNPGDERYYQVRARNSAGWGEFSQPAYGQTLTGVPRAPGLTVRANGSTEIKLTWTKPDDRGSDITGYQIEESDDGSEWSSLIFLSDSESEYVHTGLSGGTTKHYRVRAVNANGDGEWSSSRSARTDAGGPDAPVLTLTVAGDNQIDLSWTVPANNGSSIRGYWVERSADGNEPWERLTSSNSTNSYSDDDLYRGMTRHYRVAAFNGAGTGPYSNVESGTTTGDPATAPGEPTLVRLSSVGRSEVTLTWEPPTDDGGAPVSGYEYEVAGRPCEDDPLTDNDESESTCNFDRRRHQDHDGHVGQDHRAQRRRELRLPGAGGEPRR